ncbi:phospholipase D-like domain-containing protein [Bacillus coahuilensis]|uniref:phospholipase D-like domain-containing protein n=1 Tax=Bacillus coahuilensis TaxID=408580 RepID=UPI0002EDC2F2|nr:phospholipase D-like domain-containing protein [Bacillus coahuilensis]
MRDALVEALVSSEKGDTIWIGMFYLADRDILQGIHTAAQNEASIKIILDPNQNAFGQQKMGLPNLPIASELMELNDSHIDIRWYNTNKEQYHTKLFYKQSKDQHTIIGGSSNFTSRNLDDYNLEEDIKIVTSPSSMLSAEVEHYFSMLWNNEGGEFTTEYDTYQDSLPVFKYILYWLQKVFQVTTY